MHIATCVLEKYSLLTSIFDFLNVCVLVILALTCTCSSSIPLRCRRAPISLRSVALTLAQVDGDGDD